MSNPYDIDDDDDDGGGNKGRRAAAEPDRGRHQPAQQNHNDRPPPNKQNSEQPQRRHHQQQQQQPPKNRAYDDDDDDGGYAPRRRPNNNYDDDDDNYAPNALSHNFNTKYAYFYREGDHFQPPQKLIITHHRYPNFELLLSDLNKKIHLPRGVRAIYSPKGRHAIEQLDDLDNNGHYICSSNQFRGLETDINKVQDKPRPWHATKPALDRHLPEDRYVYLSYRDQASINNSLPRKRARHDAYQPETRSEHYAPRRGQPPLKRLNDKPQRDNGARARRSITPNNNKRFLPDINENNRNNRKRNDPYEAAATAPRGRRQAWGATTPPPTRTPLPQLARGGQQRNNRRGDSSPPPMKRSNQQQQPNGDNYPDSYAELAGFNQRYKTKVLGPNENAVPPKRSDRGPQPSNNYKSNNNNNNNNGNWPTGVGYRGDDYVIPPGMYQQQMADSRDPPPFNSFGGGGGGGGQMSRKNRIDYNRRSISNLQWTVRLTSGDMPNGASTSDVLLTMYGHSGVSPTFTFKPKRKAFISGSTEIYPSIKLPADIGDVYKIRLEISNTGTNPDWLCDSVELEDENSHETLAFPCRRWLSSTIGDRHIVREIPALSQDRPPVALVHYELTVQTGNLYNAATGGRVFVTLFGERGDTGQRLLKNPLNQTSKAPPFSKNSADVFVIESVSLGELRRLRVQHEPESHAQGWYLENIIVREKDLHATFVFPAGRWINQREEDRKLIAELKATDLFNYARIQEKEMWPMERWKFKMAGAELVFFSCVSMKALRVTGGGFIDARSEVVDIRDGFASFFVKEPDDQDNDSVIALHTTAKSTSFISFSNVKIVSKGSYSSSCDIRVHVLANGAVVLESDKYPSNFISVANNGQLYPETQVHAQAGPNQSFFCYVKGSFRDGGIVMLCTSKIQTLCIDRDPSAVSAAGGRNKLAHFRVHKVATGNIRMFESMVFPGHFLQIKKGTCNCLGNGDRYCEFKVRRCREQNYVTLESLRDRGYLTFANTGGVQVANEILPSNPACRLFPEIVEFGEKKLDQKQHHERAGREGVNREGSSQPSARGDPDSDLNSDVDDLYRDRYRRTITRKDRNNKHQQAAARQLYETPRGKGGPPGRDNAPAKKKDAKPGGLRATLFPAPGFNPKDDCKALNSAISKSDADTIIKIICRRTVDQRNAIVKTYKDTFKKEALSELHNVIQPASLMELMADLFIPSASLAAAELKKAMTHGHVDEMTLIDIIASYTNEEITQVKLEFQKRYGKSLDSSLMEALTGFPEHILLRLLTKPQAPPDIIKSAIENDAKLLHTKFDQHVDRYEDHFLFSLLTGRSGPELRAIFDCYKENFHKDVQEDIKAKIKDEKAEMYFSTVAKCLTNPQHYFAERIHDTLSEDGDLSAIDRIVMTRCEMDTENIKEEFHKLAGGLLAEKLNGQFSGHHLDVLLYLLNDKDPPKKSKPEATPRGQTQRNEPQRGNRGGDKEKDKKDPKKESKEKEEAKKEIKLIPTVVADPKFDVKKDCENLKKAMKGAGTDEATLINILTHRSWKQRQEIVKHYKEMHKVELAEDIRDDTSDNFQNLLIALVQPPMEDSARDLNNAIHGKKPDDDTQIEIICSKSNEDLQELKEQYQTLFKKHLEEEYKNEKKGTLHSVLAALVNRPKSPPKEDPKQAKVDAKEMHDDIVKGGEDAVEGMAKLFSSRGQAQMRLIFDMYKVEYKNEIEDDIPKHFPPDIEKAFLSIIGAIRNRPLYFAKRYQVACSEKFEVGDEHFTRLTVARCEIDLENIKQEYEKLTKKSLVQAVEKATGAEKDFKTALVSLINGNNTEKDKKEPVKNEKEKVQKDAAKDTKKEDSKQKGVTFVPTVVAEPKFDAKKDCEALKKAMKGLGTDEDSIVAILTKRSWPQRQEIEKTYKEIHKEELEEELKGETSGSFFDALQALLRSPHEIAARDLNKAIKSGKKADEDTQIEIICSKSNDDLQLVKDEYKKEFKKGLDEEYKNGKKGSLQSVLAALVNRPKSPPKDDPKGAKADAKEMHDAIAKGADQGMDSMTKMFASRGQSQLRLAFDNYKADFKAEIEDDINKTFKGDIGKAYLAIVGAIRNRPVYFAKRYQAALAEKGDAQDEHLIRLTVSRCEIDLENIKAEYEKLTKKTLVKTVEGETSEDFQDTLVSLINGNNTHQLAPSKKQDDRTFVKSDGPSKPGEKGSAVFAPTVFPEPKFDVTKDCEAIKKAMGGVGTDENALITVLTRRAWPQRQEIMKKYKELNKKELEEELKSETSGDFLDTLMALLKSPHEVAARDLNKAVKGSNVDNQIEIICSKSNDDLQQVKDQYKKLFSKALDDEYKSAKKGTIQSVLGALVNRPKSPPKEDPKMAKVDAKEMRDAIAKGGDEGVDRMTKLFATRGQSQLRQAFNIYNADFKAEIEADIGKSFKGDIGKAFLAIVGAIRNRPVYFAKRYQAALAEKSDVRDEHLIRLTTSRCEIDLQTIKTEYEKLSKKELVKSVEGALSSGDFRDALVSLINGNKPAGPPPKEENASKEPRKAEEKSSANANVTFIPTVFDEKGFDAKKDVEALAKAIPAKDHKTIISILTRRSWRQRESIIKEYKEKQKKELEADISNVTNGDHEKVMVALLKSPVKLAVSDLNTALEAANTDEDTLIEVICTKPHVDLQQIKEEYKKKYSKSLEDHIKAETKKSLESLLVALLNRPKSPTNLDSKACQADAKAMHDAIEKGGDKGEEALIAILAGRGQAQLRLSFDKYKGDFKTDIEADIEKKFSGDIEKAFLAVVGAIRNKPLYFAKRFNVATEGIGTDEEHLIRLTVSRCEVDLGNVKDEFEKLYKKPLAKVVESETSGEYQQTLLSLINGNKSDKESPKNASNENQPRKAEERSQPGPPQVTFLPTVTDEKNFDAKKDVEALAKAIPAKDHKTIISILTRRSWRQREAIIKEYKEKQKKDLEPEISSATSGDYESVMVSLLRSPVKLAVADLNTALEAANTDEATLIEIICTKPHPDLQQIKEEYKKKYSKSLDDHVKAETKEALESLLVALLNRPKSPTNLDAKACKADAKAMHDAIEKGGDKGAEGFTSILTSRGQGQLRVSFNDYKTEFKSDIEQDIEKKFSGDIETAYLAVVGAVRNKPLYFAKRFNAAMEGIGTKEDHLTRLTVSRCEVDLGNVKEEFEKLYKKPLAKTVESESSGDYQKALLSLISGNKGEEPPKSDNKKPNPKEPPTKPADPKAAPQPKQEEHHETAPKETMTFIPTVVDEKNFDAKKDSEALAKAISAKDNKVIIGILTRRSWQQRAALEKEYKELHKKELEAGIKDVASGDYEKALLSLLKTPVNLAVSDLYAALKDSNTDEDTLIEIICTKPFADLQMIKEEYKKEYKTVLDDDIKAKTKSSLESLLIALLNRPKSPSNLDAKAAKADAEAMHAAIQKGGDEGAESLTGLLTSRGQAQLRLSFDDYKTEYKNEIEADIEKKFNDDIEHAFLAVVGAIRNRPLYFAKRFNSKMDGVGTNEDHLTRLTVSRCEVDLGNVKDEFEKLYKKSLAKTVESETSGDYQKTLLSLINGNKDKPPEQEKLINGNNKAPELPQEKPPTPTKEPLFVPTVVPEKKFDVKKDVDALAKAIKAKDHLTIIDIITKRSWPQRQDIVKQYKESNKKDLEEDFNTVAAGNYLATLLALIRNPVGKAARDFDIASKSDPPDEGAMLEIVCTKSFDELQQIKDKYNQLYKKPMDSDFKADNKKGSFKSLMESLINRPKSPADVDVNTAKADAKSLHDEIAKSGDQGAEKMANLFANRGQAQLRLIFDSYRTDNGTEIEDEIMKHFSSSAKRHYLGIVGSVRHRPVYFAKRFNTVLTESPETRNEDLIRLVVSRCEVDLESIKAEYFKLNHSQLLQAVENISSEEYRSVLASLIIGNNSNPAPTPAVVPPKAPALPTNKEQLFLPTVVADKTLNVNTDSETIGKAIKAKDHPAVIAIITKRSWPRRQDIAKKYKDTNKKELEEDFKTIADSSYLAALLALVKDPIDQAVQDFSKALKSEPSDEGTLLEIACTKTYDDLQQIKERYKKLFKKSIDSDFKSDKKGSFQSLMAALLNRPKSPTDINADAAKEDAKSLHDEIAKGAAQGAEKLTNLFSTRGQAQLRLIFDSYHAEYHTEIEDEVIKNFASEVKKPYLAIVGSVRHRPVYFAKRFNSVLTREMRDEHLIRLTVSRCEVDLESVKTEYFKLNHKPLVQAVENVSSGEFRSCMSSLINGNVNSPPVANKNKPPEQLPTVIPEKSFDVKNDYEALVKAIKAKDNSAIINVVTKRAWSQRQDIAKKYKDSNKKELEDDFNAVATGSYLATLLALIKSPTEQAARDFHSASTNEPPDEGAMLEIVCSKTYDDLQQIKEQYNKLFEKSMDSELESDKKDSFNSLIVALLQRPKSPTEVDVNAAKADANSLHEKIAKGGEQGAAKLKDLFASRGQAQLRLVFDSYKAEYKTEIEDDIIKQFSGDSEKTYLALVTSVRNRPLYFAKRFNAVLKESSETRDEDLIRLVVSRCEVDLESVKAEFLKLNPKEPLVQAVDKVSSGDFQNALISLINGNSTNTQLPKPPETPASKEPIFVPTVVPDKKFEAKKDVEILAKAIEAKDHTALIGVITKRSWPQRQDIVKMYKDSQKRDLEDDFKTVAEDNYLATLLALVRNPIGKAARDFFAASKSDPQDEGTILEIISTKSYDDLQQIKEKYKKLYDQSMDADFEGDGNKKGSVQSLIVALLNRPKSPADVDQKTAKTDAKDLHDEIAKDGEKGADKLTQLFSRRGQAQLRLIFDCYKTDHSTEIEDDIIKHFSSDVKRSYLAIVTSVRHRPVYFAKRFNTVLTEPSETRDEHLIRLVVSRCEVDLESIKGEFFKLNHKALVQAVESVSSEQFKCVLVSLINGNNSNAPPPSAAVNPPSPKLADKEQLFVPTVIADKKFEVKKDTESLMKAIKANDHPAIIAIITKRSWPQRKDIAKQYKDSNKKELEDDFKAMTEGSYLATLLVLIRNPVEQAARDFNSALTTEPPDEGAMLEIICTKSYEDLQQIKEKYNKLYNKPMDDNFKTDKTGSFQALMVALLHRPKSPAVADSNAAKADAKSLHDEIAKGSEQGAEKLADLMATHGHAQLRLIFDCYRTDYNVEIEDDIMKHFTSKAKMLYLAIVGSVRHRSVYFAKRFNSVLTEPSETRDEHLIRLVVSRCEVDLESVKGEFFKLNHNTLIQAVEKVTSNEEFQSILVSLINGNADANSPAVPSQPNQSAKPAPSQPPPSSKAAENRNSSKKP